MMEIFDWSRLLRDISDLVFLALTGALEVRMLLCLSVHLHYALFGIFGSERSSGSANVTLSVCPPPLCSEALYKRAMRLPKRD